MTTTQIEKKAKIVHDSEGHPIEVILPYSTYQALLELQISIDIYRQRDTQASIRRAKKEIEEGKTQSFENVNEAFGWLEE